jgi:hypothetical protein
VSLVSAFAGEYLLHLVHWLWQSALVATIALTTVHYAPGTSARFRATVLALALWKFFLPPMLPAPTGGFSRFGLIGSASLQRLSGSGLAIVLTLAAVHAVVVGTRLLVLWRALQTRRRLPGRSLRRGRVRLVLADPASGLSAPVAFGWLRPTIVCPARVWRASSRAERRLVLAHERAHLRRLHGLLVLCEELIAAIGWIHPLFRATIEAHRRVREELCDADAVRHLRCDPTRYARGLVRVAGLCGSADRPAAAIAAIGSAQEIATRIVGLSRRSRWSLAEFAAALSLWLILLPGIQPRSVPAGQPHHPIPRHAALQER